MLSAAAAAASRRARVGTLARSRRMMAGQGRIGAAPVGSGPSSSVSASAHGPASARCDDRRRFPTNDMTPVVVASPATPALEGVVGGELSRRDYSSTSGYHQYRYLRGDVHFWPAGTGSTMSTSTWWCPSGGGGAGEAIIIPPLSSPHAMNANDGFVADGNNASRGSFSHCHHHGRRRGDDGGDRHPSSQQWQWTWTPHASIMSSLDADRVHSLAGDGVDGEGEAEISRGAITCAGGTGTIATLFPSSGAARRAGSCPSLSSSPSPSSRLRPPGDLSALGRGLYREHGGALLRRRNFGRDGHRERWRPSVVRALSTDTAAAARTRTAGGGADASSSSSSTAAAADKVPPPPTAGAKTGDSSATTAEGGGGKGNPAASTDPPPPLVPPRQQQKTPTPMSEKIIKKSKAAARSVIKWMWNVLRKTPGVLWFYLTNPSALRDRMVELKEAAKNEANHYYMGTKLLAADMRTARKMLLKTLQGNSLTRRERKQLLRTTSDLFRLVPMSMFVLIPFMEFALPFALKVFPNMLPSTFQDSLKEEENMKRELKSRIAMAEFFQETLQNLAKQQKKQASRRVKNAEQAGEDGEGGEGEVGDGGASETELEAEDTAASFLDFLEKARAGDFLPPDAIIRFSKYFQDELTLDNLPRTQLVNMCKYMNIPAYGSEPFLRFQLRHRIRSLRDDDQRILWEGIKSLTKMELREACRERGMRSVGLSKNAYRVALQQWLDLSVNKHVPIALLVMSRSFFLQEELSGPRRESDETKNVAGIADAMSAMDKDVLNEIVLEVATKDERRNPDIVKISLEVLEQENERIKEEREERDRALAKKKAEEEEEEAARKKAEAEAEAEEEEEEAARKMAELEEAALRKKMDDEEKAAQKEVERAEMESGVVMGDAQQMNEERGSEPTGAIEKPPEPKIRHDEGWEEGIDDSVAGREQETEAVGGGLDYSTKVKSDDGVGASREAEEEEDDEETKLSPEELEAISEMISPNPVESEREELERIKTAMLNEEDDVAAEPLTDGADKAQASADTVIAEEFVSNVTPKETIVDVDFAASPTSSKEADAKATFVIETLEAEASKDAEAMTVMDVVPKPEQETRAKAPEGAGSGDKKLDATMARLKAKVESMVGKIELQLSDVEAKIGNKMHFLDKDMDGFLSYDEIAQCLQLALRRELTFEEAMAIAADMDEDADGHISVAELNRWLETNKIVKLAEEGRDEEVDRAIAKAKAQKSDEEEPSSKEAPDTTP